MPSITINEKDLTLGGGSSTELNVVYVPGFVSKDNNAWPQVKAGEKQYKNFPGKRVPTLCSTIAEFEMYFGKSPLMLTSTDDDEGESAYPDKSYLYAKELINLGLHVLYEAINDPSDSAEPKKQDMYDAMMGDLYGSDEKDATPGLADKGEYSFKYLTSGGYPTFEVEDADGDTSNSIVDKMIDLAANRGDCVAIIDHQDKPDMDLVGTDSVYTKVVDYIEDNVNAHYATMFTPWVNINCVKYNPPEDATSKSITFSMPPSYGYLAALAYSIKTNASWLAVAGATRGQIPNIYGDRPLNITKRLTNSIAETVYQHRGGVSINAITNIKPFGYRIWGNRTLKNNSGTGEENLTATSFLNTRNMISDIKKVIYAACKKYTFEQNNDVLWLNFKSAIEPTLNQMKTGAGISGYKIIQESTTEKAKLVATVKLYPLYAVEDFEISVQMLDDDEVKVS